MSTLCEDYMNEIDPRKRTILSQSSTNEIDEVLTKMFPFVLWGRVNWEKVNEKTLIDLEKPLLEPIYQFLNQHGINIAEANNCVYIIWDNGSLPAVKTETKDAIIFLQNTLDYQGDNVWIFSPSKRYVIEFFHEGEIVAGIAPELIIKLEAAYKNFLQIKIKKEEFPLEYSNIIADIISVGEYIAKLARRILAHEEIEDADKLVLQKEYLTKSAWRVPLANPYPLVKIPPILDYARKTEELRSLCANVLLHREVLKL